MLAALSLHYRTWIITSYADIYSYIITISLFYNEMY
jgi:hypothetical protein